METAITIFLVVAIFPPTFCTPVLSFYHSAILSSMSSTFKDSNVYRPVYFYIEKKLKMSIFLVNYISLLSSSQTPIHRTPNSVLKFCAQILCSNSMLRFCDQILCSNSVLSFSSSSSLARCGGLSLVHSALRYITHCAQRAEVYYSLCTAR